MSWKKQSSRTNTGNNTFVNNNYSLSTNLISEESKILGKGLFYNDVDICGNLTVGGTLVASNIDIELLTFENLVVSENLLVNGTLGVSGNVDFSNNLFVAGDISCNGTLVASNIDIELLTFENLEVSENLLVNGTLGVGGNVDFSNNLTIGGTISGDYLFVDDKRIHIGYEAGQNNQNVYSVAIGNQAGQNNQNIHSVAIGRFAGKIDQCYNSVAIGYHAGRNNQNQKSIAIGSGAGQNQQSQNSVAIGNEAGLQNQNQYSVAIGYLAGYEDQNQYSVAIGYEAGTINQNSNSVAIGNQAGRQNQNQYSVAIGTLAGSVYQKSNSVAIGYEAGLQDQNQYSVAIGYEAGTINQNQYSVAIGALAGYEYQKSNSVAIGYEAGQIHQGEYSVAIGKGAGQISQKDQCIAIGYGAGTHNQVTSSIAIGVNAGNINQGSDCIAIGYEAGYKDQCANSIVLYAKGSGGNTFQVNTSGLFIAPIRDLTANSTSLFYDTGTKEVFYSTEGGGGGTFSDVTITNKLDVSGVDISNNLTIGGTISGDYLFVDNTRIHFGYEAGLNNQGEYSVAIGYEAGQNDQDAYSVAIGYAAGKDNQNVSIAIGNAAGQNQKMDCIAIGTFAGQELQKESSIAIGKFAGKKNQGEYSVAIGYGAGDQDQSANSIILNAQYVSLNCDSSGLFIAPIRDLGVGSSDSLFYNATTKEVFYSTEGGGGGTFDNLTVNGNLAVSGNITNGGISGQLRTGVKRFAEYIAGRTGSGNVDGLTYIDENNEVNAWGNGSNNSIGVATTLNAPGTTIPLPPNASGVASKVYRSSNLLGILTTNNDMYFMGQNDSGQFSYDDNSTNLDNPVMKKCSVPDVKKICFASGVIKTIYYVTTDGKLYAAGDNEWGVIGNGNNPFGTGASGVFLTQGPGSLPANGGVDTLVKDAVLIGAEQEGTGLCLFIDGTVKTVGTGGAGQLGIGTNGLAGTWKTPLYEDDGGLTELNSIKEIQGCGYITATPAAFTTFFALDTDNKLWGWGSGKSGILANGSSDVDALKAIRIDTTPISDIKITDFWACGGDPGASLFVKEETTNKIYACGNNTSGQLGLPAATSVTTLTEVTSLLESYNIKEIIMAGGDDADFAHTYAVTEDDRILVSGLNLQGQCSVGSGNNLSAFEFCYTTMNNSSSLIKLKSGISRNNPYIDLKVKNAIGGTSWVLSNNNEAYTCGTNQFYTNTIADEKLYYLTRAKHWQ